MLIRVAMENKTKIYKPNFQKITTEELKMLIAAKIKDGENNIIISEKEILDTCSFRLADFYNTQIISRISLRFETCIFTNPLELTGNFPQRSLLTFEGCLFKNQVYIHDSAVELDIDYCRFNDYLNLSKIKASQLKIDSLQNFKSITIDNCEITTLSIFNSHSLDKYFVRLLNNRISNYIINDLDIHSFEFYNNNEIDANISIVKLTSKSLLLSNVSLSKLSIDKFNIEQIEFHEITLKTDLTINIDDGGIANIINFGTCKYISVKKCEFPNFILGGSHLENPFEDKRIIEGKTIEIELGFDTISKGNMFIDRLNISKLFVYGNNNETNISIQDCEITEFKVHRFINRNIINLTNLIFNKNSTVNITNSYFGQTLFTNIDFNPAKKFYIHLTQLIDIKSNNVSWPINIKTKNHIDKKSIYRQLKSAMLSQNDKIQALEFEAKEMDAYRKEIQTNGEWYDKFILWASSTNDFGQNWWKAIKYLIRVALIFHLSAILFINWGSSDYLLEIVDKIEAIAYYFNPIHTTKDLWGIYNSSTYPVYENISDWFYFFDFLARLVTGFFYFQIVRAFRKYAR